MAPVAAAVCIAAMIAASRPRGTRHEPGPANSRGTNRSSNCRREAGSRRDFRRVLGVWQLTAIGIGGIIGVGIFVLAGQQAAANAGPAVALSLHHRRHRQCRARRCATPNSPG